MLLEATLQARSEATTAGKEGNSPLALLLYSVSSKRDNRMKMLPDIHRLKSYVSHSFPRKLLEAVPLRRQNKAREREMKSSRTRRPNLGERG